MTWIHAGSSTQPSASVSLSSCGTERSNSIPCLICHTCGASRKSCTADSSPLWHGALATGSRALTGFGIGAAVGIVVALFLAASRTASLLVAPYVLLAKSVPVLSLIPIFILWFGLRESARIGFIAASCFFWIVVAAAEAIENVSMIYRWSARTLGATPAVEYRTIVLPAILPGLFGGLRNTATVSFALAVAAEFLWRSARAWLLFDSRVDLLRHEQNDRGGGRADSNGGHRRPVPGCGRALRIQMDRTHVTQAEESRALRLEPARSRRSLRHGSIWKVGVGGLGVAAGIGFWFALTKWGVVGAVKLPPLSAIARRAADTESLPHDIALTLSGPSSASRSAARPAYLSRYWQAGTALLAASANRSSKSSNLSPHSS